MSSLFQGRVVRPDAVQRYSIFDGRPVRYAADKKDDDGQWITLGGHEADGLKHKGG